MAISVNGLSVLKNKLAVIMFYVLISVADPDLELRGRGGGGGLDLLALLAFFPSVISYFFLPKIRGLGEGEPPWPFP